MKTHAKTHGLRRFLCGLTALATAALMAPMSAIAGQNSLPVDGITENGVHIDKGATDLVNDQTTVTLQIGADSSTSTTVIGADVVFVLDKSTSADVEAEAISMLNELKKEAADRNLQIQVGAVVFNRNAENDGYVVDLQELNDASCAELEAMFKKELSSGTNLEAGIRKGISMLAEDKSIPDDHKHLVLVTDGITYIWGSEEPVKSVYSQRLYDKTAAVDNVMYISDYVDTPEIFANAKTWCEKNGEKIEEFIKGYESNYTSSTISSSSEGYEGIKAAPDSAGYTSLEGAMYKAALAWQDADAADYNLYAYAAQNSNYPWGPTFIAGLSSIGGDSGPVPTDVTGMFDKVKNTVLENTSYRIQSGTVTDYISKYFDLTSVNSIDLKVNGVSVGLVTFDNLTFKGNATGKDYEITYNPTNESFTLKLPTVESNETITLSYDLKLDRDAVNADTTLDLNQIPTNTSAELNYKSTDGTIDDMAFPIPYLKIEGGQSGGEDPEDPPVIIPDNPSLTIRKIWENDSASDRPDSITVDIYHDGEYYDSMVISGRRFGDSDTWRDSYDIPARYEDDDWWVVESDVPAYYDSDVEEVRENVFYITNTYEEPVIEEPVSSEPESSEPSSEPSEVIPSGPSEEPSAPSSEPTSEPSEPAEPTLPQTGQTWWPIIILLAGGAVLVAFGAFRTMRGSRRHDR